MLVSKPTSSIFSTPWESTGCVRERMPTSLLLFIKLRYLLPSLLSAALKYLVVSHGGQVLNSLEKGDIAQMLPWLVATGRTPRRDRPRQFQKGFFSVPPFWRGKDGRSAQHVRALTEHRSLKSGDVWAPLERNPPIKTPPPLKN